jgi:transcriptional regulator with XRE-family HTH domain
MPKSSQTFTEGTVIKLGKTIRYIREAHGQSQIHAARLLGISNVHLSNLEHNKAYPSPEFTARAATVWGIDLHVAAWCLHGEPEKLPPRIRDAATKLTAALKRQLAQKGIQLGEPGNDRDQKHQDARPSARTVKA